MAWRHLCLFSLNFCILGSPIIDIKSQSCKLNQLLFFPTKEIKLVWNKLGCLLYPQSFRYLQFMFSVTLSKIYSSN